MGAKPLSIIRFVKLNRVFKIFNGTRYLELFGSYNAIYAIYCLSIIL